MLGPSLLYKFVALSAESSPSQPAARSRFPTCPSLPPLLTPTGLSMYCLRRVQADFSDRIFDLLGRRHHLDELASLCTRLHDAQAASI